MQTCCSQCKNSWTAPVDRCPECCCGPGEGCSSPDCTGTPAAGVGAPEPVDDTATESRSSGRRDGHSRIGGMNRTPDAWHLAYRRWYDHDRAGHPRRAAAWGWIADHICRLTKTMASGVNATQGYSIPDGADEAPGKAKGGVPAPSCSAGHSLADCGSSLGEHVCEDPLSHQSEQFRAATYMRLVADEEALVEWFREHWTCRHSLDESMRACAFCLAKWLLRSDWLAVYATRQVRPVGRVEESGADDELNLD